MYFYLFYMCSIILCIYIVCVFMLALQLVLLLLSLKVNKQLVNWTELDYKVRLLRLFAFASSTLPIIRCFQIKKE